jgi:hypothetical protein
MGGDSGRRSPVGKLRGKRENAVWRGTLHVLEIRNWKVTPRKREVWSKEIGEATVLKWAEVLYTKKRDFSKSDSHVTELKTEHFHFKKQQPENLQKPLILATASRNQRCSE